MSKFDREGIDNVMDDQLIKAIDGKTKNSDLATILIGIYQYLKLRDKSVSPDDVAMEVKGQWMPNTSKVMVQYDPTQPIHYDENVHAITVYGQHCDAKPQVHSNPTRVRVTTFYDVEITLSHEQHMTYMKYWNKRQKAVEQELAAPRVPR